MLKETLFIRLKLQTLKPKEAVGFSGSVFISAANVGSLIGFNALFWTMEVFGTKYM